MLMIIRSSSPLVFAELFIERFCMTGGNSPIGYLKAYSTNLYLSADPSKVREALEEGQRRGLEGKLSALRSISVL